MGIKIASSHGTKGDRTPFHILHGVELVGVISDLRCL